MEVNYYGRPYGLALYAVGAQPEDLPNDGDVFARGEGLAQLWYERLGGFRNLAEAREFCRGNGYPEPVLPCIPG